jgi:1-acyl-sn-glycerol-3-phosphate acyltransferase
MIERAAALLIVFFARFITAVRAEWTGHPPDNHARIYFANHASHGDFVLIWAALPPALRARTRPVAGADYWEQGALRRLVGKRVFNAVLVERDAENRTHDPIQQMAAALSEGSSLILFPEGTRNQSEVALLPFRSGLYRLALAHPSVEMLPVWIANLNRVMPKGELIPVPIICTVSFGLPLRLREGEEKSDFLERARAALLSLRPKEPAP